MFDEKPAGVVDIFADTEKPGVPGQSAAARAAINVPVAAAVSHGPSKLLLGGIILVVLGLGGAGAWYFMSRQPAAPVEPVVNQAVEKPVVPEPVVNQVPAPEPTPVNEPAPAVNEAVEPAPAEEPVVQEPVSTVDTDQDGLTDSEEASLGTDPDKADTDNDGLTDLEETRSYGTDPTNPDTDGDTFPDGSEVKNGYNPRGPGKLFGIPAR